MGNVRIYTLWHRGDDDEAPWIIDAVDEYTIDNNGEFPPPYLKKREDINVRELILDVPEARCVGCSIRQASRRRSSKNPHDEASLGSDGCSC